MRVAGVCHAQGAQGVEIVALDDEVGMRPGTGGQFRFLVQRHEVGIERAVVLDGIAFPNEAEFPAVARLQQRDELFAGEIAVIRACHAKDPIHPAPARRGNSQPGRHRVGGSAFD